MQFRHFALAAGFAAILGASLPAFAGNEAQPAAAGNQARMEGYAPTVQKMLQEERGFGTLTPMAPTQAQLPSLTYSTDIVKPRKVGMDPVYSYGPKKTKKKAAKKKAVECPPGMVRTDTGCEAEAVEAVVAPEQEAAPAAAETTAPTQEAAPALMERTAPATAEPTPTLGASPATPASCPPGTMSDVSGNCLPLSVDPLDNSALPATPEAPAPAAPVTP